MNLLQRVMHWDMPVSHRKACSLTMPPSELPPSSVKESIESHTNDTHSPTLLQLGTSGQAYIDHLQANPAFGRLDTLISRRLSDLGFLPGMPIKIIAKAAFGRAPIAVQIGQGAQFSLRKEEAQKIVCHW